MRLLHVTPFFEPAWDKGGMARASAGLARALEARGHEVTVVTTLPGAASVEESVDGIRVLRWGVLPLLDALLVPSSPGWSRRFRALARDADIGHVHGHRNGLSASAAHAFGGPGGIPYVLQPHGTYPRHGRHVLAKRLYDRLVGNAVMAGAAAVVAVSHSEARDLPRPSVVVANGVRSEWDRGIQHGRRGNRLIFVGNDRPQKRGHLLPALLAAVPEAHLDCVGRFGEGFRRRFRSVAARVTWRGVLHPLALANAYAGADLLVHPAVGEAFGLVPFEAALCGTAAVVAAGHGCGEWFARASGATVVPDDLVALAAAVRQRLADPGLGRREAAAVARFAAAELTWEAAARATEAVYERLHGARGACVA